MMLNTEIFSFHEFIMREPLPLSEIQVAVIEFLQGRDDAVLFGAQAVNAYVSESRATQDVDIMSTRAKELAEELRQYLSDRFHIAVRVREVREKGLRIYQVRKEGNRHLIDVRILDVLPESQKVEDVRILSPPELIASKVTSYISRQGKPKSWTDRRDLAVLINQFPELKIRGGAVENILLKNLADARALQFWHELVETESPVEEEDDDLLY